MLLDLSGHFWTNLVQVVSLEINCGNWVKIQRDNLAERNDKGPGGITTWITARDANPPITARSKRMRHARSNSFYSNGLLTESIHRLLDLLSIKFSQFINLFVFHRFECAVKRSLIDCFRSDRLYFYLWYLWEGIRHRRGSWQLSQIPLTTTHCKTECRFNFSSRQI